MRQGTFIGIIRCTYHQVLWVVTVFLGLVTNTGGTPSDREAEGNTVLRNFVISTSETTEDHSLNPQSFTPEHL